MKAKEEYQALMQYAGLRATILSLSKEPPSFPCAKRVESDCGIWMHGEVNNGRPLNSHWS